MDRHDFVVRRLFSLDFVGDIDLQLGDRFFRQAAGEIGGRKDRIRIEADDDLLEVIDAGLARADGGVFGAVAQNELDRALGRVEDNPAVPGHVDFDRLWLEGVGEHDVVPARLARLGVIPGIQDPVGKVLKEHPRLDVAFDLLAERRKEDFAVLLVGVRDRRNHHVKRRGGRDARERQHGSKQPVRADTAGQQRDCLAIGRQPAKANQQPDQQRHRNRQAQGLRAQKQDDPADSRPRNTFREEPLELLHHGRQFQDEREDQQRQDERRNDFADDVAVNRPEHQRNSVDSITGSTRLAARSSRPAWRRAKDRAARSTIHAQASFTGHFSRV